MAELGGQRSVAEHIAQVTEFTHDPPLLKFLCKLSSVNQIAAVV